MMRSTHTYVLLEVSKEAYQEIKDKLLAAGYDHLFDPIDEGEIDMTGIALVEEK